MAGQQGRYYRITPRFWQDRDVRSWSEDSRWLAVYLISSPHRNMTGLFYCPLIYIQSDLQWPANRLQKAFEGLVNAGFIEYDADAEVVLITNALKHDSPGNENQVKGAINALLTVPQSRLLARLLGLADEHCETLSKAMRKAFEGLSKEIRTTVSVSVPVTDTVTEERESKPSSTSVDPLDPTLPSADEIADLWNTVCGHVLPKVTKLTAKRRTHVKARLREKGRDLGWWRAYFSRILASSFCCGENQRGWMADFDFAVRSEDVVTSVYEGKYDDKKPASSVGAKEDKPASAAASDDTPMEELLERLGVKDEGRYSPV